MQYLAISPLDTTRQIAGHLCYLKIALLALLRSESLKKHKKEEMRKI